MIALGVSRGPVREARSYTSTILNAVEAAAAGTGGGVAAATASVETAAGLWARGLALATVEPMNRRTAALRPSLLAFIGRALCRHGEVVLDLRVDAGEVKLLPASSAYVVVGAGDPRSWVYTVTVDGPGDTATVYRRRAAVAHVQYAVAPIRPWQGRPPWAAAGLSGELLAGVERQLAGEARSASGYMRSASGYILPTPDVGDHSQDEGDDGETDPLTTLRKDLAAAGGRTVLASHDASGLRRGPSRGAGHRLQALAVRHRAASGDGGAPAQRCARRPRRVRRAPGSRSSRRAGNESPRGLAHADDRDPSSLCASWVGDQLSEALGDRVSLAMPRPSDVATLAAPPTRSCRPASRPTGPSRSWGCRDDVAVSGVARARGRPRSRGSLLNRTTASNGLSLSALMRVAIRRMLAGGGSEP